jgi:transposase
VIRHRLSLAGNRRLNLCHAHDIALCQVLAAILAAGRTPRKKLAEGKKSRREAMRCLKRRVSDAVYGALVADSGRASLAPA